MRSELSEDCGRISDWIHKKPPLNKGDFVFASSPLKLSRLFTRRSPAVPGRRRANSAIRAVTNAETPIAKKLTTSKPGKTLLDCKILIRFFIESHRVVSASVIVVRSFLIDSRNLLGTYSELSRNPRAEHIFLWDR